MKAEVEIIRELIDIPNHPTIAGVTRKAKVFRLHAEYDTNKVILKVEIFHYLSGEEMKFFKNREDGIIELVGDNNVRVNPATGATVDNAPKGPDGKYTAETMGEFTFLWNIVNVSKAKTLQELEDLYPTMRIERINQRLYGI